MSTPMISYDLFKRGAGRSGRQVFHEAAPAATPWKQTASVDDGQQLRLVLRAVRILPEHARCDKSLVGRYYGGSDIFMSHPNSKVNVYGYPSCCFDHVAAARAWHAL
jgi:hypothetical protein